jgi:predicted SnoaL-like aldol condensation-catalyzing enzyme
MRSPFGRGCLRSASRTAFLTAAIACVSLARPMQSGAEPPAANRALMSRFAEQFYARKDVRGAFEAYVESDYIQHNPGLRDGRDAAVAALTPMFATAGAQFEVKHLLVDGDLALIHLFGRGDPATTGAAVVDLYRLHAGRIVEHWDVIQSIKARTDPLADAAPGRPSRDETAANRGVMTRFIDLLYRHKEVAAAYRAFVANDLIEHSPGRAGGRDASIAALTPLFAGESASFDVKHALVDGNLAAVHYHGRLGGPGAGAAVVEIFRLRRGKIVEHWDAYQPIPTTSVNPHPMF